MLKIFRNTYNFQIFTTLYENRGEWHTYPETGLLSDETKQKVLTWYKNAFKVTKLQTRDPGDAPNAQIGFHDDSFGYYTVRYFLALPVLVHFYIAHQYLNKLFLPFAFE
jgi:hypothetical protein